MAELTIPGINHEEAFWSKNKLIAGVDEAGRGCLAGPVVSAAVILKPYTLLDEGINDSKMLQPDEREKLYEIILSNCVSYSVGVIDNKEIDDINILQAAMKSMRIAVSGLKRKPKHLLVDGNQNPKHDIKATTIISGDSISLSIAAASIIAKVYRDNIMKKEAHLLYPQYNFAQHKGYATKEHFEAIEKHGTCDLHRMTFLRKFFNRQISIFEESSIL